MPLNILTLQNYICPIFVIRPPDSSSRIFLLQCKPQQYAVTVDFTSLSLYRATADGTEEPRACSLPREFFQCHSQ